MLNFTNLWKSHPTNLGEPSPCRTDGSPSFTNQCAIRVGTTLNACGVSRSQLPNPVLCWFHDKSELHILRAEELAAALDSANIEEIGATFKVVTPTNFRKDLKSQTGIVFFKDYWLRNSDPAESPTGDHIDVWDGKNTAATSQLSEWHRKLTLDGYGEAKQIWFWEVQ